MRLVFWGFVAFAGYTSVEFLYGLGIADLTARAGFTRIASRSLPFAAAVLAGILYLLVAPRDRPARRRSATQRVDRVCRHRAVHRDADGHVPAGVPP